MMYLKYIMPSLVAASLLFTACGNNDATSSDPSTGTTTEATTATVSGSAVDGYLRGAYVCIDSNGNNDCDTGEPYVITGPNGEYSLNYSSSTASANVVVVGGTDKATGKLFRGVLKAPLDKSAAQVNITPLTTLVAAKIEAVGGDLSDPTVINAAVLNIADTLGIAPDDIKNDPVAIAAGGNDKPLKKALQVQKVIEILQAMEEAKGIDQSASIDNIAKSLASQCTGSPKEVATITDDAAADPLNNIDSTVASAAANMATAIADSNSSDIEAVADILITAVEAEVGNAVSVDINGTLVIGAINTTLATSIDTNASVVERANLDRMLALIGYTDVNVVSDANKTELETYIDFNSSMEIAEFKAALDVATASINDPLEAALNTKIALALTLEASIGATANTGLILDVPFYMVRADYNYTDGSLIGLIGDSHMISSSTYTHVYTSYLWDKINDTWLSYTPTNYSTSSTNIDWIWTGTQWKQRTYTVGSEQGGEAVRIDEYGVAIFSQTLSDGTKLDQYSIGLLATNDVSLSTQTVGYFDYLTFTEKSIEVPFSAGAKQYILEQKILLTEQINSWDDGNSSTFEGPVDYLDGVGFTSLDTFATYITANNYDLGSVNGNGDSFTQLRASSTSGVVEAVDYTNCSTGCTVGAPYYGGTWSIVTVDGLRLLKMQTIDSLTEEYGQQAFAIRDGFVRYVYVPTNNTQNSSTMPLYNDIGAKDVAIALETAYTLP